MNFYHTTLPKTPHIHSFWECFAAHPSHHLSNHPIPAPAFILSAVRAVFHQLHFVLEAHFLGYFREQVHTEAFQLCDFVHCIRLLLEKIDVKRESMGFIWPLILNEIFEMDDWVPLWLWFSALIALLSRGKDKERVSRCNIFYISDSQMLENHSTSSWQLFSVLHSVLLAVWLWAGLKCKEHIVTWWSLQTLVSPDWLFNTISRPTEIFWHLQNKSDQF